MFVNMNMRERGRGDENGGLEERTSRIKGGILHGWHFAR